jgi:hypothetical protein
MTRWAVTGSNRRLPACKYGLDQGLTARNASVSGPSFVLEGPADGGGSPPMAPNIGTNRRLCRNPPPVSRGSSRCRARTHTPLGRPSNVGQREQSGRLGMWNRPNAWRIKFGRDAPSHGCSRSRHGRHAMDRRWEIPSGGNPRLSWPSVGGASGRLPRLEQTPRSLAATRAPALVRDRTSLDSEIRCYRNGRQAVARPCGTRRSPPRSNDGTLAFRQCPTGVVAPFAGDADSC